MSIGGSVTGTHEEQLQRMRDRTGLIRLGRLTQDEAFLALRRSLPRTVDAVRLFDLVEARLGDQGVRDYWANPRERCLLVRDVAHEGWFLPRRLIYLELDRPPPPSSPLVDIELPDWLKAPEALPPTEPEVVTLGPPGRPARLRLEEGAAYVDLTYDDRGRVHGSMGSVGDLFFSGLSKTEPFHVDTHARPAQTPPLGLMVRDDLRPEGHALDALASMVLALRPDQADAGRVWVPAVTPGGVTGAWTRGLWHLRTASWEDRLSSTAGWVVIDAFNGMALATGATFDEAFAAWQECVRTVQPLPPVELEPDLDVLPDRPPSAAFDEVHRTATFDTGTFQIVFHPPVILSWPEPRPENVPAIAVPIPATPSVPAGLTAIGFGRVVRLFGEQGEAAFAFVRDEADGFTLVGDDALGAIDHRTLDAEMERVDRERALGFEDHLLFAEIRPWDDPQYPVHVTGYRVWDDTGRLPEFRAGGGAWTVAFVPHGWELDQRHQIQRVRFMTSTRSGGRLR